MYRTWVLWTIFSLLYIHDLEELPQNEIHHTVLKQSNYQFGIQTKKYAWPATDFETEK